MSKPSVVISCHFSLIIKDVLQACISLLVKEVKIDKKRLVVLLGINVLGSSNWDVYFHIGHHLSAIRQGKRCFMSSCSCSCSICP